MYSRLCHQQCKLVIVLRAVSVLMRLKLWILNLKDLHLSNTVIHPLSRVKDFLKISTQQAYKALWALCLFRQDKG